MENAANNGEGQPGPQRGLQPPGQGPPGAAADPTIQAPLPPIMSQDDPRRMLLTEQERQWAIDVKNMVEMIPDIDGRSDFWCAQLALVCQGDFVEAVRRLNGLQDFMEEYSIFDTLEDAERAIREGIIRLCPGMHLAFQFCPEEGTYCRVVDLTQLNSGELRRSPRELQQYMAGMYFIHNAMTPDLESIRKGVIGVVECEGVGWNHKHDFEMLALVAEQLWRYYPINHKSMKFYHIGVIFNLMFRWVQKVLPQEIRDKLDFGGQLDNRLDAIYLVPNQEAATQRLSEHLMDTIRRRYRNEESFSLNYETR
jgi:CRAL/TRIO domain